MLWLIFIWHLVWVVAVALAIAFACAVAIVARTLAGNKTENEKSIALHLARSAATHAEPNLLCHLLRVVGWMPYPLQLVDDLCALHTKRDARPASASAPADL